ncbi:MAG: dinitrogenase iron-molybdenum cofactor biosynthesis protein [Desulfobulbaceae bacterium]|nr:MAG: dinitrogenase iron-molybdenum cofactor biosynthesis protein [Desulfobulbaceae bacterium]
MKVAIPTEKPGGLTAPRSEHFGHCDVFTIVEVEGENEAQAEVIANTPHGAGGCIEPVTILKNAGVDAIVVSGMGARPMQGFADAGIKVYFADLTQAGTASDVITKLSGKGLPVMHPSQACKGSGNCHH